MAPALIITLCIYLLCSHAVETVTVHFSSPGVGYAQAGVYRTEVDVDTLLKSPAYEVSEVVRHFTCTLSEFGYMGSAVRSMSYDAAAERIVVPVGVPYGGDTVAVFSDHTCGKEKACGEYGPGFRWLMQNQTIKDSGLIRVMSSWNDTLYFVYIPANKYATTDLYRPYVQLRKVNTGHDFSNAEVPDAIGVESFSTLIANFGLQGKWLHTGSTLLIVPGENNEDLTFLTVARAIWYPKVQNEDTEYSYYLVAIHDGKEEILHNYKHQYQEYIPDLGGISYKDGTLCWTMVDSILCGTWSPDQPFTPPADVEAVLAPGQARKVCTLKYGQKGNLLGNVTAGVALVETPKKDGRLILFFGCQFHYQLKGGMGLLVKNSTSSEVDISSVRYEDEPLHAGLMFVTPDEPCDVMEKPKDIVSRAEQISYAVYVLLVVLMLQT